MEKIIYYEDELNDEFSSAQIDIRTIDENYVFIHGPFWDKCSLVIQNVLSMPIKYLYAKLKFRIKFIGKEKVKPYKSQGYFIYGNHTQPFADTFIPSLMMYPKRNFFIVNPANVSIKGIGWLVAMLGAIPIPTNINGMKGFLNSVEDKIKRNNAVTIYPEAHIWPYYTGIRPFKDVSFKYPVRLKTPVFCFTNCYVRRGKKGNKVQIVTYVDGPFYPDETLKPKERQRKLRDEVYNAMCERAKNSNVEVIRYVKKENKVSCQL